MILASSMSVQLSVWVPSGDGIQAGHRVKTGCKRTRQKKFPDGGETSSEVTWTWEQGWGCVCWSEAGVVAQRFLQNLWKDDVWQDETKRELSMMCGGINTEKGSPPSEVSSQASLIKRLQAEGLVSLRRRDCASIEPQQCSTFPSRSVMCTEDVPRMLFCS